MARESTFVRFVGAVVLVALLGALLSACGSEDAEASGSLSKEWEAQVREASHKVGFPAQVPTFFPTEANELKFVEGSAGPPGRPAAPGTGRIVLTYAGEAAEGERPSVLDIFVVTGVHPNGSLWEEDLAGFEVWRDVVGVDPNGNETKVTYTAISDDFALVLNFSGEQPDREGLQKMLESLQTVDGT